MFYAGTRKTELLTTYIRDIKCNGCHENTEHFLQIYCDAFVFGVFYPLKWWAWNKEGSLKCKNCGRVSTVDENNLNLPPKILNYYQQTKIPFRYKLPTLTVFPGMLLIAYFFIFNIFSSIFSALQPAEKKLPGKWEDEFQVYTVYFYDNKNMTVVNYDSIAFGNYQIDENFVHFSIFGKENSVPKKQLTAISIMDFQDENYLLKKQRNSEKIDDIYLEEKNVWRKKPAKSQTDEELRKRVLDYLHYEREKFKIADEEKLPYVVNDVNAPVVFASNGYQVINRSTEKWRSLFYNDIDWERANEILYEEFPKEFKGDPNEKNPFDQNVRFLSLFIQKVKGSNLKFLDKLQKNNP